MFSQVTRGAFQMDYPMDSDSASSEQAGLATRSNTDNRPRGFDEQAPPPFEDGTTTSYPSDHGVIVIKNIPYSVTKSEIYHFIGRRFRLIEPHLQGMPIHIVMERSTSKTMDCFVELQHPEDAYHLAARHENAMMSGRHPKMGTRHVGLEISSQDELLTNLFPRAKNTKWLEGIPIVFKNYDAFSSGFNGFFTSEEIIGMIRHAEVPQRSPFSAKCLQRTYECMISTLYKFPWFAPQYYTLEQRNKLFTVYCAQLRVLVDKVEEAETVGLDNKLIMDFFFAGMNCPGFGERMKSQIVKMAGRWADTFNLSPLAAHWPFDVLGRQQQITDDSLVGFYLHLTELGVCVRLDEAAARQGFRGSPFPYGEFFECILPNFKSRAFDPDPILNSHFQFNTKGKKLTYDTAMSIEKALMSNLLIAGWKKWQQDQGFSSTFIRTDSAHMDRLDFVKEIKEKHHIDSEGTQSGESVWGDTGEHLVTPRPQTGQLAPMSPPQSPKGTVTPETCTLRRDEDDATPKASFSQTSRQPIGNALGSMSARQSRTGIGNSPPFTPYQRAARPRMFSDPTSVVAAHNPFNRYATHGQQGYPAAPGPNQDFVRGVPVNQSGLSPISPATSGNVFNDAAPVFNFDARRDSGIGSFSSQATTIAPIFPPLISTGRRNAAIEIKRPSGSPVKFSGGEVMSSASDDEAHAPSTAALSKSASFPTLRSEHSSPVKPAAAHGNTADEPQPPLTRHRSSTTYTGLASASSSHSLRSTADIIHEHEHEDDHGDDHDAKSKSTPILHKVTIEDLSSSDEDEDEDDDIEQEEQILIQDSTGKKTQELGVKIPRGPMGRGL